MVEPSQTPSGPPRLQWNLRRHPPPVHTRRRHFAVPRLDLATFVGAQAGQEEEKRPATTTGGAGLPGPTRAVPHIRAGPEGDWRVCELGGDWIGVGAVGALCCFGESL